MPPKVLTCLRSVALLLLLALFLVAAQTSARGQTSMPDKPGFARVLKEVLELAHVGQIAVTDPLTGKEQGSITGVFAGVGHERPVSVTGALCFLSEILFRCEWESAPNKYSIAVLMDGIVSQVSAVLPDSWHRERQQSVTRRVVEFTDPSKMILLDVTCPVTESYLHVSSYTVTLSIQSRQLR